MGSGHEFPRVAEIQILCDEKPLIALRGSPNFGVIGSGESFVADGIHIMAQGSQQRCQPLG